MTEYSYLAQLAQDCVMTDHHLDTLRIVATPPFQIATLHGAPFTVLANTVVWETALVKQVRRSWRLALQFQAGLDALAASR